MLRIYDDADLTRRTRLKHLQVLALFAGGVAFGGWITHSGLSLDLLPAATASKPAVAPADEAAHWCVGSTAGPRLDCRIRLPTLTRAEGI
ncbi:hypothetical protein AAG565_12465 [Fontimonas sp. SYSU GA230001]|uniref:hypothetical protein n=1 Tax=Fontimonas sp. SYSU GA230001 TaxID=3142450 RepID=UPI0032B45830